MKTAIFAASRAKHQQIHNSNFQYTDKEALKVKLQNARKQKLEHKLVSQHAYRSHIVLFNTKYKASITKGNQVSIEKS
jgi:hypothetical protein